mgnify:CR=1 FL=1
MFRKNGEGPLYIARQKWTCQQSHVFIKQRQRQNNVIMCKWLSPLNAASFDRQDSTVELLIKNGATVYLLQKNETGPLHAICQNGHSKIVQLLINYGVEVNADGNGGGNRLFLLV